MSLGKMMRRLAAGRDDEDDAPPSKCLKNLMIRPSHGRLTTVGDGKNNWVNNSMREHENARSDQKMHLHGSQMI